MEAVNFIDFGQRNENCHIMNEGFMLWEITGNENKMPVFLKGDGTNMIVHVLMLAGEMRINYENKLYPLTKDCFAHFIDSHTLEIQDISYDVRAYVMFFTTSFITSLLKSIL